MAGFLFKLEMTDGTPAEPSSFSSARAQLGSGRDDPLRPQTMRVVGVRGDDFDETRVLVVEDVAE